MKVHIPLNDTVTSFSVHCSFGVMVCFILYNIIIENQSDPKQGCIFIHFTHSFFFVAYSIHCFDDVIHLYLASLLDVLE